MKILTDIQQEILDLLKEKTRLTFQEISDFTGYDKTTIYNNCKVLEERGLLKKKRLSSATKTRAIVEPTDSNLGGNKQLKICGDYTRHFDNIEGVCASLYYQLDNEIPMGTHYFNRELAEGKIRVMNSCSSTREEIIDFLIEKYGLDYEQSDYLIDEALGYHMEEEPEYPKNIIESHHYRGYTINIIQHEYPSTGRLFYSAENSVPDIILDNPNFRSINEAIEYEQKRTDDWIDQQRED